MALTTLQPFNINSNATFSFTDVAVTDVSATGNVDATGNVTGDYIIGNGSSLTHLTGANVTGEVDYAATANSVAGANVTGAVSYATTANSVAVANVTGIGNISLVNLDGNSGNILYGNGVFSSAPNVQNANTANYASVANSVIGSNVSGEVAFAAVANSVSGSNVSGAVAYATTANSVAGANVSGAVNLATYAGTANSVAGANVTGEVNYAATANSVAGANVSGQVNYAATANSVAGANVSGAVSYATTANSVALANVSGIGNIASLNIDGNSGNILYGNGVFSAAPNVEYSNIANTAGTVTTNAQPNITSVGTLTILTSTGNVTGGNLVTSGSANVGGGLSVSSGGASISGDVNITGNIGVTGNFNVTGNLNYQNVTDLVVGDPLIYLAANSVGDTEDIGLVGNYNDGGYAHTGLARDHSDNTWKFFANVQAEPTTVIDWANAQYPTVKVGNLLTANLTGSGWANLTGNITAGNADLGNSVIANYFIGNGASLSSLTGANVTGAVAYASTANSVAGANVSGAVAYASTANSVAGANVSGQVSYAATANSVAGANVSGAVGLATYATTANAVAGANVSGAVGYATTANSVAGANVSGAVAYATTANSVAGANVSGTVSAASTAGTVTTAAQPNITSTGTLTSLGSSGNITAPNVVANTGAFYGSGSGLTSIPAGNLTGTISNDRVNGQTYTINITGAAGTAGTVTTAAQPNITSTGTLSSVSVSGLSTTPKVLINRSSGATTGISWYSSSYSAWTDYMASVGATSCGPFGNITAPEGNLVTAWGLRSFIEDSSGYGWTWESGSATQTTPTVKAEIRSSDGSFRNTGNIYCVGDVITNYSDINLKDIVGPIENAVEKVCAIETFYYRPNQTAKDLGVADELQVGVSAQSVKKVASETTRPSPIDDKYLTVMYERLVPYLIESIKEHEKTIQDLKEQINSLKGK